MPSLAVVGPELGKEAEQAEQQQGREQWVDVQAAGVSQHLQLFAAVEQSQ